MNYGLSETTISSIREIFTHFPEIEKAIIYGHGQKEIIKTAQI